MSTAQPEDNPDRVSTERPAFDRRMLEVLVCPLTHAVLHYDAAAQELISKPARLAFPIRGGIPILIPSEARDLDVD
ncbi:Trm112 family protein [Thioclava sp. GXIMD4216]|uniref:UPF0434 protein RPE78_05250 n=1 Tax=Thioclava litoralis TaxID=3076557 RepID=A0ABZ1E0W0_9RHOB|nr:Trm112 family protein [Thioclava sp. FTW29]